MFETCTFGASQLGIPKNFFDFFLTSFFGIRMKKLWLDLQSTQNNLHTEPLTKQVMNHV